MGSGRKLAWRPSRGHAAHLEDPARIGGFSATRSQKELTRWAAPRVAIAYPMPVESFLSRGSPGPSVVVERQVKCTQEGVVSGGWHERSVYSKGVLLGKPESHSRRGVWGRRGESAKPPSGSTTGGKASRRLLVAGFGFTNRAPLGSIHSKF